MEQTVTTPIEPACEGHPRIVGVTDGVHAVLRRPDVLEGPVLEGAGEVDGLGVSIYGSVIGSSLSTSELA